MIYLGETTPIHEAGEDWRAVIMRGRGEVNRDVKSQLNQSSSTESPQWKLRRLLWEPLEKHLDGIRTVLVSPDGAVARLPFAALPGKSRDRYLFEERSIVVVPIPRQLPFLLEDKTTPKPSNPSLLLVGGVDFGASPGGASEAANRSVAPQSRAVYRKTNQNFARLPGTKREIEAVAETFRSKHPKGRVLTLESTGATENRLRTSAANYKFLHLATHGFFSPNTGSPSADDLRHRQSLDPGLFSGIVLAGANRTKDASAADAGQDDGIFTALEFGSLDLRKVDLAVLSACETGLGKTANGEGVLGL